MRKSNTKVSPQAAAQVWNARPASGAARDVFTANCMLVTPMYGGGVTAGSVDWALPIRPTAVRGQLRFWWRLLQGASGHGEESGDSRRLFETETALWGGISSTGPQASKVTLRVEAEPVDSSKLVTWRGDNSTYPVYALILEQNADPPRLLSENYRFRLRLSFTPHVTSEQREQVIEAVRWWASFGGVGARTRRGLGAVQVTCESAGLRPVSVQQIKTQGGCLVVGRQTSHDAVTAWRAAVEALQRFRQGSDFARNPGHDNRPGRTRWPEADAIRRRTGKAASGHQPQHPVQDYYPRAALGLPIVFHFKNSDDPGDHTLNPVGQDRMASPLILRSWFDGERWRPAALLLPGWQERVSVPVGLASKGRNVGQRPAWPKEPDERRRLAPKTPMSGLGEDALSAFLHFFENRTGSGLPIANRRNRPKRGR